MEPSNEPRSSNPTTWLIVAAVFVAAVAVTLFVGSRGDSSSDSTFPDLGDLTAEDPTVPGTDEAAPGFVLTTHDGGTFSLKDHIANDGRPVVLNLWASWCAPCRAEMPAIDAASQRHPDVAFVGVSVQDDVEDATAFATEINVSYTIAFDDGTVEDSYPVLGLPATFFIDGDGTIVKRHFGIVTVDSIDDDIAELFS